MNNQDLSCHLKKYREYLIAVKNYSPLSVQSYLSDLSHYFKFHQRNPGRWESREYLSYFLKELFTQKYANSSILRYRSSLSGFFEYLVKQRAITSSPSHLLGRYKQKPSTPKIWSQEKVKQVLQTLKPHNEGVTGVHRYLKHRDLFITEMFYGLGLRISELTRIQIKDLEQGMVMILGKGDHHQLLPLTPRLEALLPNYLKERSDFLTLIGARDFGYLLCNHRGKPLTIRGTRYAFQSRLHVQGIGRFNPHGLRHSLAAHLMENGAGIRQVQKVLRHRSIATTQVYTQLSSKFLKQQYNLNHPLAQKKMISSPQLRTGTNKTTRVKS